MILNMNPDGRSGSAVCFRCVDPRDGGHLRGFWREVEGVTRVRLSRGVRSSVTPSPSVSPGIGTIEKPTHRGPGSWVLCHRTPHGMSRRGSRCGDLLDVLRVSDTRSQSDRVWGQAVVDHHEGREVGDRLVSLNRMVPVEWKIVRTRRGSFRSPTRWEVTGTRWVMCDLDGFTDGPVGDGELELGGLDLERWAESHPLLTGRVGIVRTSHLGVQMVVELREVKDPRRWWRTREGITFTEELDRVGMEITHAAGFAGGHPDQSVHNGGRLMRRPGWRVDKRGDLTRSRLVFAS